MAAKQSLHSSHLHRFRPFLMLMHGWIYPRFHLHARRPNFWLTPQTNFHSIWVRSCFTLERGTWSWQIMWRQRAGHSSGRVWPALKIWWDRPKKGWALRQKGDKAEKMLNWDSADVCWNLVVWLHIYVFSSKQALKINLSFFANFTWTWMSLPVACVHVLCAAHR